ncbi:unnamed protein product [Bemisia tabaci]|uniref:Uncharacterized protein n=1 Tax=Bemisia tabaci TaxID=7038 RepID=A0A9P0AFF1_BEMTA|nr:unnamed protein product [Bemisia tabaci]
MDIRADQNISYESKKELIFDFQTTEEYMRKDWKFVISTNAAKFANAKRRNKVPLMPLEADIKTMSTYLTELENSLYDKLKECPDPNLFEKMCEAVIADLIVFNCRQAGEVARAELNDYLSRNNVEFEENLESLLSPSELAAKASLTTFYILGKRGRSVPILMTETMKKCVDLLVTLRDKLEVPNKNKLLFPRLYSDRPYDSCRIIRDLKSKINLQKPDHFTSTGLRHEVATHSKIQNADKNYTSVLASHMGHTESVHESNYQLPVPLLQVSKVGARLLERRGKCDGESIEKEQSQSRQAPAAMDPTLQHPSQSITETETEDEKKDPTYEEDENQSEDSSVSFSEENIKTKERPVKKDTSTTRSWTSDEYSIVLKSFAGFLKAKKRPGKVLCEKIFPCPPERPPRDALRVAFLAIFRPKSETLTQKWQWLRSS